MLFRSLALDFERGAYQNHYRSETYPRLEVVKEGAKGEHATTYYVDGIVCADLGMAVVMLNTEPHPQREGLARHQQGDEPDENTSSDPDR